MLNSWPTTSVLEQELNDVKEPRVMWGVWGVILLMCAGPCSWLGIFSFCVIAHCWHCQASPARAVSVCTAWLQ